MSKIGGVQKSAVCKNPTFSLVFAGSVLAQRHCFLPVDLVIRILCCIYISKKNGKCVIACYNGTEPIIWDENSAGLIIWVETTGTGPAVLGHSFGFSVMYR